MWTGDAGPRIGGPLADRDPDVVLLARPARQRAPAAVVWQLVTYDRHTRAALADIAQRWRPAGTGPDFGDGQDGNVPQPVHQWLTSVLGPGTTVAGPAADLAGPTSWHIHRADGTGSEPAAGHGSADDESQVRR